MKVRWDDDGLEEDVRIGGSTTFAVQGSLRHQALVDPEPLAGLLDEDPLAVICRLLREHGGPMKAPMIKDQLKVLGLGQEAVDQAWRKVQGRLAKLDEVRVRGGAYRWIEAGGKPAPAETVTAPQAERGPVDEAEAIAQALRAVEDPEARVWAEVLSWHASVLSGGAEAVRAKDQFVRKFGIDPWKI